MFHARTSASRFLVLTAAASIAAAGLARAETKGPSMTDQVIDEVFKTLQSTSDRLDKVKAAVTATADLVEEMEHAIDVTKDIDFVKKHIDTAEKTQQNVQEEISSIDKQHASAREKLESALRTLKKSDDKKTRANLKAAFDFLEFAERRSGGLGRMNFDLDDRIQTIVEKIE